MTRDLFSTTDPDRSEELAGKVGRGARMLGETPEAAESGQAYTVSAVNAMARKLLENAFPPVWVSGEVTGWTRHSSGHCYFSLRDADAQLRCVMFRRDARQLPTDPEEGMKVRALGGISVYERRGIYQLIVRQMEGRGKGGLWRVAFERLKSKLDAEGLLDSARKRVPPGHPDRIGVVTSPVGAALQDVIRIVERRAPWMRLVLCPSRVQGDGAAEEIARAIRVMGRERAADVLIVGRGGGSVEDLWAFNEEPVARAIAESPIPVISAVGHEVDVTIADLVADVRAPTPSAAAEHAVPDGRALERQVVDAVGRMEAAGRTLLSERRGEILVLARALARASRAVLDTKRQRLARVAGKLDALSPLAALRRGYAVPVDDDGRILRSAEAFEPEMPFRLRVADGTVGCRVDGRIDQPTDETSDG